MVNMFDRWEIFGANGRDFRAEKDVIRIITVTKFILRPNFQHVSSILVQIIETNGVKIGVSLFDRSTVEKDLKDWFRTAVVAGLPAENEGGVRDVEYFDVERRIGQTWPLKLNGKFIVTEVVLRCTTVGTKDG